VTIAAELEEVKAKLDHLLDRQAILDCINRYCRGLDRLDAQALADTFHPDAVDHHGRFIGHVPEFLKWGIAVEAQHLATQHHITCHLCEIDGSTAHTESYVFWVVRLADGTTAQAAGGRYIDRLEKRDGEWRVVLRRLLLDWKFEAPSLWDGSKNAFPTGTRDRADPCYQRPLKLPPETQRILDAGGNTPVV
jgi:hypothetical protein